MIGAALLLASADAGAFTAIAMSKGNPRATLYVAAGHATQQEADEAATNGCKAVLKARGWASVQCDILERQPRPGFGAIACNGLARCVFGYGAAEQSAQSEAMKACAALASGYGGTGDKCSLGTELGKRDIDVAGSWFDDNKPASREAAPRPPAAPPTAQAGGQPSGSLQLMCQMQTGQSYIFVVDEQRQLVSVRDSTGGAWVTFRNSQTTRQRLGNQLVPMIDSVRVDAAAIRAVREPQIEQGGAPPNVSSNRQTSELAGVLGELVGIAATASSVVIDRNSGVIRTGGMTIFPNNGAGTCERWSGRRF
jgi:hypothetical protein